MIRIDHERTDGVATWRVTDQGPDGSVVAEFNSQIAELAVGFALAAIQSARQFRDLGLQGATPARLSEPARSDGSTLRPSPDKITAAVPARTRGTNRAGSRIPKIASIRPMTCGQRMTQRRLELRLTQVDVASLVTICPRSGHRRNAKRYLSRNSYCMYELDSVEPSLSTIIQIADALSVSPAWLAFGD